jgi:hypothetical protein
MFFLQDEEFQIRQKYKPITKSHYLNLHVEWMLITLIKAFEKRKCIFNQFITQTLTIKLK